MRNFIQAGGTVVVPARLKPSLQARAKKAGRLFGAATNDAALVADVARDLTGVFEL